MPFVYPSLERSLLVLVLFNRVSRQQVLYCVGQFRPKVENSQICNVFSSEKQKDSDESRPKLT